MTCFDSTTSLTGQFTPPDSPTMATTPPLLPTLVKASSTGDGQISPKKTPTAPVVFVPKIEKSTRSNKVPIYKLGTANVDPKKTTPINTRPGKWCE
jgi:hypothetical protein